MTLKKWTESQEMSIYIKINGQSCSHKLLVIIEKYQVHFY